MVESSWRDRLQNFVKPTWLKCAGQNIGEERAAHKMRDAQRMSSGDLKTPPESSAGGDQCMHLRRLFETRERTTRKGRQNYPQSLHRARKASRPSREHRETL